MTDSFLVSGSIDASIIVPTYRDRDALQRCLDCLAKQTVAAARIEIIVADNDPDNDPHSPAPATVVLPDNARLVRQPKAGSYAARNAALAEVRAPVVFFTDADCLPATDWVERALALLDAEPKVDRIGGAIELEPAGERWRVPELYDRLFNLRQARYVERGYAATANLVVRRHVFDRTGLFDETLFSSGDKEWNRRAGKAGFSLVYAESVRVRHGARDSFAAHAKKRARVAKGRLRMRVVDGRPTRPLSLFRYRLPSPGASLRILLSKGPSLSQRFAMLAFDYRLRRHEHDVTLALLAAKPRASDAEQ